MAMTQIAQPDPDWLDNGKIIQKKTNHPKVVRSDSPKPRVFERFTNMQSAPS